MSSIAQTTPSTANGQIPPYMVYGNLIYLVFVFFPLFFRSSVAAEQIIISVISVLLYLPLHFTVFRATPRVGLFCSTAMVCLALAVLPVNVGANTYVIYGVISAAYFLSTRGAILFWLLAHAVLGAEVIYLDYPLQWAGISMLLSGAGMMQAIHSQRTDASRKQLEQSQHEVQRLARLAERERISRDLHDVLGHTMSLIVMKSELAQRLALADPQTAANHMQEVSNIGRDALAQIRYAVSEIRSINLQKELEDARSTLLSAGIKMVVVATPEAFPAATETAFALAVREAVTNIIRHANAKNVEITLQRNAIENTVLLKISDDGNGNIDQFGNGLNGMRERVELLGGTFNAGRSSSGGACLQLKIAGTNLSAVAL